MVDQATAQSAVPRMCRVERVDGPPVVAVRVWLRGGQRSEEIPGQALLAGRLLAEGTQRRDWRSIADQTEALGMDLVSFGGREVTGVAVDALAGDWKTALERAAEVVFEATFPADRFDVLRRQTVAELTSLRDQPEVLTGWDFLRQLYLPHPWSWPLQGDEAGLAKLSREDCVTFHRQSCTRGLAVAVTGDIDVDAVRPVTERLFGRSSDQTSSVTMGKPSQPQGAADQRREIVTGATDQAQVYLGHLSVARDDPALPALDLVGVVLGAGPGLAGRLTQRIREHEGWAYAVEVDTAAGAGLDPGRLQIYAAVSPENVDKVEAAVREELVRLLEGGVEQSELEEAKAYLVGREPFRRETARQWSEILAEAALYGRPVDNPDLVRRRWSEVTLAEATESARRFIRPHDLQIVVGWPRGVS